MFASSLALPSPSKSRNLELTIMIVALPFLAVVIGLPSQGLNDFLVANGVIDNDGSIILIALVNFVFWSTITAVITLGFNNGLMANQWLDWRFSAKLASAFTACSIYGMILQTFKLFMVWFNDFIANPRFELSFDFLIAPIGLVYVLTAWTALIAIGLKSNWKHD